MNKTIFKYLLTGDITELPAGEVRLLDWEPRAPVGLENIRLTEADYLPTIWIEHAAPPQPLQPTKYIVRGTGHIFPDDPLNKHVGSCRCGPFIWHVYQRVPV